MGKYSFNYTVVGDSLGGKVVVRTARLFDALARDPAASTQIMALFPSGLACGEDYARFGALLSSDDGCKRRLAVLMPSIVEDEIVEQSFVHAFAAIEKKLRGEKLDELEQVNLDSFAATVSVWSELVSDLKSGVASVRREAG